MQIKEIISEGVVQIWSRTGGKMVRKYRCTSGPRKGRIVASPGECVLNQKKLDQYLQLKKQKREEVQLSKLRLHVQKELQVLDVLQNLIDQLL